MFIVFIEQTRVREGTDIKLFETHDSLKMHTEVEGTKDPLEQSNKLESKVSFQPDLTSDTSEDATTNSVARSLFLVTDHGTVAVHSSGEQYDNNYYILFPKSILSFIAKT